jgi:hypothetical protein
LKAFETEVLLHDLKQTSIQNLSNLLLTSEIDVLAFDFSECTLFSCAFKGRLSDQKHIENDATAPNVRFKGMHTNNAFRCQVLRSANQFIRFDHATRGLDR